MQVNKDKAQVVFMDSAGKVLLVYGSPSLRSGNKTLSLPFEFDVQTYELSIVLPSVQYPISIAFGVGALPSGVDSFPKAGFSFGFKRATESEDSSSDSETEDKSGTQLQVFRPL